MIEIPFTTLIAPILETIAMWIFLFMFYALAGPENASSKIIMSCAGICLLIALIIQLTRYDVLLWK